MEQAKWLWIFLLTGAVIQELFWWFNIRHKLSLKKYKNLIRSKGYWLATLFMIIATTAGIFFWKYDRLEYYSPIDCLIFGAAFPIFIKEIISILGKKEHKLGAYATSSLNSYFLVDLHDQY